MIPLVLYCLAVYLLFHLACCADLFARPRAWAFKTFPSWLTYPLQCALCFTFWVTLGGILATHYLGFYVEGEWTALFCAPVVNMLVDLYVRVYRAALDTQQATLRFLANAQPPNSTPQPQFSVAEMEEVYAARTRAERALMQREPKLPPVLSPCPEGRAPGGWKS